MLLLPSTPHIGSAATPLRRARRIEIFFHLLLSSRISPFPSSRLHAHDMSSYQNRKIARNKLEDIFLLPSHLRWRTPRRNGRALLFIPHVLPRGRESPHSRESGERKRARPFLDERRRGIRPTDAECARM